MMLFAADHAFADADKDHGGSMLLLAQQYYKEGGEKGPHYPVQGLGQSMQRKGSSKNKSYKPEICKEIPSL